MGLSLISKPPHSECPAQRPPHIDTWSFEMYPRLSECLLNLATMLVVFQKKAIEMLIYGPARSAVPCPINYGYVFIIDHGSAPEPSKMKSFLSSLKVSRILLASFLPSIPLKLSQPEEVCLNPVKFVPVMGTHLSKLRQPGTIY